jgi:hypothetical protein
MFQSAPSDALKIKFNSLLLCNREMRMRNGMKEERNGLREDAKELVSI